MKLLGLLKIITLPELWLCKEGVAFMYNLFLYDGISAHCAFDCFEEGMLKQISLRKLLENPLSVLSLLDDEEKEYLTYIDILLTDVYDFEEKGLEQYCKIVQEKLNREKIADVFVDWQREEDADCIVIQFREA